MLPRVDLQAAMVKKKMNSTLNRLANQTASSSGNVAPIVGGVVGGIVALAALAAVLLYLLKFKSGAKFSNEKMRNKDFKENPFYDDVT